LDEESWDEATGAEWAMVRRDAEALTAERGARGREVSRRSMMGGMKGICNGDEADLSEVE
jgi:hypothetical protein